MDPAGDRLSGEHLLGLVQVGEDQVVARLHGGARVAARLLVPHVLLHDRYGEARDVVLGLVGALHRRVRGGLELIHPREVQVEEGPVGERLPQDDLAALPVGRIPDDAHDVVAGTDVLVVVRPGDGGWAGGLADVRDVPHPVQEPVVVVPPVEDQLARHGVQDDHQGRVGEVVVVAVAGTVAEVRRHHLGGNAVEHARKGFRRLGDHLLGGRCGGEVFLEASGSQEKQR